MFLCAPIGMPGRSWLKCHTMLRPYPKMNIYYFLNIFTCTHAKNICNSLSLSHFSFTYSFACRHSHIFFLWRQKQQLFSIHFCNTIRFMDWSINEVAIPLTSISQTNIHTLSLGEMNNFTSALEDKTKIKTQWDTHMTELKGSKPVC